MINRMVTAAATAMVVRMVLKGKWPWLWLWFSECKWCLAKVWLATVGGSEGTVVGVLTSMSDHRANQEKKEFNGFQFEVERKVEMGRHA